MLSRRTVLGNVIALRLLAPSPDSKSGVTLAGSSVDPGGRWTASTQERIHGEVVDVPHMSAVVLRSASRGLRA